MQYIFIWYTIDIKDIKNVSSAATYAFGAFWSDGQTPTGNTCITKYNFIFTGVNIWIM